MKKVCIVGVGLIGGSLGLALRRSKKRGQRLFHVTGLGRSRSQLKKAKQFGCIDKFFLDAQSAVQEADIIVLCVPVQVMGSVTKTLLPHLKKGAILTDAGSVKKEIVNQMKSLLSKRKDLTFVGAHPLAGSEKFGVENSASDLFQGARCVITTDGAGQRGLQEVKSLWQNAGATCVLMSAERHDQILALTSHLPHLLAFSLFSTVARISRQIPMLKSLTAGSFADMTRIAASEPTMWTGIVDLNRSDILRAKKSFTQTLDHLLKSSPVQFQSQLKKISEAKRKWM